MRTSVRSAGVLAAATACLLVTLPAGTAGAVTTGDAPKPAAPAPPPRGQIVICNHSGYMFDVFADGPSIREDDLAGSFDECTDWARVLTGNYEIGFALRVPSQQNVIIQARFKREDHVFYKVFNGQGIVKANVGRDELTRVDLYIPRA
ncbi:MAG TPA: hypothetical protein VGJ14_20415 [Sporichthyaceae bacterium]|jgi:hypothetical protein